MARQVRSAQISGRGPLTEAKWGRMASCGRVALGLPTVRRTGPCRRRTASPPQDAILPHLRQHEAFGRALLSFWRLALGGADPLGSALSAMGRRRPVFPPLTSASRKTPARRRGRQPRARGSALPCG
jgi:hypothetical protein